MNIVIPMAGTGSRFATAGYTLPKPLIPVLGEPMYAWAVKSVPWRLARRLIFVCLQDHLDAFPLEADIRSRYPDLEVSVVGLRTVTAGQAETVLAAGACIDTPEPLLIFNADTYVPDAFVLPGPAEPVDGVVQTFTSQDPRYSFVRTDDGGRIVEVAEKVPISDRATTGLYFFSRGDDYVRYTRTFLAAGRRTNGEAYVMLTYDEMLRDGKTLRAVPVAHHWVLGTPEELDRFILANRRA